MKHLKNMKNKSMVATLLASMTLSYMAPIVSYAEGSLTNDPFIKEQWALENEKNTDINIREAWEVTKGDEDVVVAVIGTGIDVDHPELKDSIYTNAKEIPGNKIDDDKNGYVDDVNGWDFYNKDNTVMDSRTQDLRDTISAGIIAASSDNEIGISGIAPNVKLLPIKVMKHDDWSKEPNIKVAEIIEAIKYAERMGAKVAHISIESESLLYSIPLYEAMKESNMLFINSAGERGYDVGTSGNYHAPAAWDLPNLITVGAINENGDLWEKTTYSKTQVDIFAPGVNTMSTIAPLDKEYTTIMNKTDKFSAVSQTFGFEQLSQEDAIKLFNEVFKNMGIDKNKKIVIVDDDESEIGKLDTIENYTKPLDEMGYKYDVVKTEKMGNGPLVEQIQGYDLVIWMGGTDMDVLSNRDQTEIIKYLDNGGNIYLCGGGIYKYISGGKLATDYLNIVYNGSENIYRDEVKGDLTLAIKPTSYNASDYLKPHNSNAKPMLYYEEEGYENAYSKVSNTTYAAAHVTGVAALIQSAGVKDPLSIKNIIMRNVVKESRYKDKCVSGGRLDAGKALSNIDIQVSDNIPGILLADKEVNGNLNDTDNSVNVYRLPLKKGDYITLDLDMSTTCDLDIYIHGPEAINVNDKQYVVASGTNSSGSEKVSFVAPKDGNYYISIESKDGSGEYKLVYDLVERGMADILVDDKSNKINYVGKWTAKKGQGFIGDDIYGYDNTIHELNSSGYMQYNFTGSTMNIYASKGPDYGITEVIVDGKSVDAVDLYSKDELKQQLVFSEDLGYGDHTVQLKWTGNKNPNAKPGSTKINFDAVSINTAESAPPAPEISDVNTQGIESVDITVNYNKQPMIAYYNLYRSEDGGETFKFIKKETPISMFAEVNLVDDFEDILAQDKEYVYKVTAVSKENLESEGTIVNATPRVAKNKHIIENTSNYVTYNGRFTEYNTKRDGDGDNTTHVTTNLKDNIVIPFTGNGFQIYTDIGDANPNKYAQFTVTIESKEQNYRYFYSVYPDESQSPRAEKKFMVPIPEGIKNGTITLENISGNSPMGFDKIVILDANEEKPQSVNNVNGYIQGNQAHVSWDSSVDTSVKGYNLYKKENGEYKKVNEELITSTSYKHENIDTSKDSIYVVTCVNSANLESDYSKEITLQKKDVTVEVLGGEDRFETAVKVSQKGWENGTKNVVIVNSDAIADGLAATPFAALKDAPILLTNKDNINATTMKEIERLKADNVYVVGGKAVVSNDVVKDLESKGINVTRISGSDRYETSIELAKEIDKMNPVKQIFVSGGFAEADALSIASKAAIDKSPIILTEKNSIGFGAYNWLKSKDLDTAYVIGGTNVVEDKVLEKLNDITSNDIKDNRVGGVDRQDTNAKIISKFYSHNKSQDILVAKSTMLVDALTAGPLAAKLNTPVVIADKDLSKSQQESIKSKGYNNIVQVGLGIPSSVIDKISDSLK